MFTCLKRTIKPLNNLVKMSVFYFHIFCWLFYFIFLEDFSVFKMSLNCWWMILQRLMACKIETRRRSFTMSGQIRWRFLNDSQCFPVEVLLDHRNGPSNGRYQWTAGPKTNISQVKFCKIKQRKKSTNLTVARWKVLFCNLMNSS